MVDFRDFILISLHFSFPFCLVWTLQLSFVPECVRCRTLEWYNLPWDMQIYQKLLSSVVSNFDMNTKLSFTNVMITYLSFALFKSTVCTVSWQQLLCHYAFLSINSLTETDFSFDHKSKYLKLLYVAHSSKDFNTFLWEVGFCRSCSLFFFLTN